MEELQELQKQIDLLKTENRRLTEQVASLRNHRSHLMDALNAYDPPPKFDPDQLDKQMRVLTPMNQLIDQMNEWIKEE